MDTTEHSQAVAEEFARVARLQLRQSFEKIEKAASRLDGGQIWHRQQEAENSIGNLLLHLAGNVRQWIISGVGGAPDMRHRDAEFAERDGAGLAELLAHLKQTLEEADGVLARVNAKDLMIEKHIQVYDVTVMHAIFHVVEHFGQHTGQILWAVKRMTGEDLGFFTHLSPGGSGGEGRP